MSIARRHQHLRRPPQLGGVVSVTPAGATPIDEANRIALRAAKVRADIVPVPIRQIVESQPAVVMTALMVSLRARGAEAIDQNRLEASIPFDGAVPIFEMACGFSAPGHDRIKTRHRPGRKLSMGSGSEQGETAAGRGCGQVAHVDPPA
jgi:hypothetical protein